MYRPYLAEVNGSLPQIRLSPGISKRIYDESGNFPASLKRPDRYLTLGFRTEAGTAKKAIAAPIFSPALNRGEFSHAKSLGPK